MYKHTKGAEMKTFSIYQKPNGKLIEICKAKTLKDAYTYAEKVLKLNVFFIIII